MGTLHVLGGLRVQRGRFARRGVKRVGTRMCGNTSDEPSWSRPTPLPGVKRSCMSIKSTSPSRPFRFGGQTESYEALLRGEADALIEDGPFPFAL